MFLTKIIYVLAGNSHLVKYCYAYVVVWVTVESLAEHFIIWKINEMIVDFQSSGVVCYHFISELF